MKKIVLTTICLWLGLSACQSQFEGIQETVMNGDIALATRLVLPENTKHTPPPVFIIVHGSGKEAYWDIYKAYVERIVNQGFAVAFFDKRGTGASTGKFLPVNVKKSTDSFDKLSDDVVAVAKWLAQRPEIDKGRVGVWGLSQGGWIAPLAMSKTDKIRFSVITSGPVCSLGHEKLFSDLAGDEKKESNTPLSEINEAVAKFNGNRGFDSYEYVAKMNVPALWLFGAEDRSMPVEQSKNNLDKIIQASPDKKFTYKVYQNADHSLFDITTKKRLNYYQDVKDWVEKTLY